MKAIQITEANKNNFNRPVGTWFVGNVPTKYIFEGREYHAYKDNTEAQTLHGWVDLIVLPLDTNTQKRTNNIIEVEGGVAYEVVDLTEAEIEARIPTTISKLNFKLGLLKEYNITNAMVDQVIEQVPDPILKEMLNLLWYESATIDRTDEEVLQFAPYLGLTEDNLKMICEKYANFR